MIARHLGVAMVSYLQYLYIYSAIVSFDLLDDGKAHYLPLNDFRLCPKQL